jgi:NADH:ubiquinone oxidoreductase subunit 5 (subunit L)/multisubunit Na+/H+ antiporter MnhA subunit
MSAEINPTATHHLPIFVTPPGQTDVLMVVTAVFLLVAVVAFGILFLRLHSLPERMAHRGHKLQFEIVAVLCLIALFTHIHGFWIAALLIALIELPDIGTWMQRIAGGVERIAGIKSAETSTRPSPEESHAEAKPNDRAPNTLAGELPSRHVKDREVTHA